MAEATFPRLRQGVRFSPQRRRGSKLNSWLAWRIEGRNSDFIGTRAESRDFLATQRFLGM